MYNNNRANRRTAIGSENRLVSPDKILLICILERRPVEIRGVFCL
nr:MAG TPA: hypothetical protein [Caudoviricetes sp.]